MTFIIGQRWISNTETQLGLGIITEVSRRQVSLCFPAASEERMYAIDNAPLSRILFKEGEEIETGDGLKILVNEVKEVQGLLVYIGTDDTGSQITVHESTLNSFIKLHTPQQRLFSGLIDKLDSYYLRIDTINQESRLQQSKVQGLLGARTSHLPHQVYIANEVAQRHAPRVLLADEVGLGKTIEAGMILHSQLHTGRAQRVLILVPDNLIHQWLVEMIRRFNLHFSIIDQTRFELLDYADLDDEDLEFIDEYSNQFEAEQLVLCGIDFLMQSEQARSQALAADWDLLIVDEAHHLLWTPEEKSPKYAFVEELSKHSKGMLLLTATPEQVGVQSHFARLRLLDPARFHDFEQFQKEEEGYQKLNALVQQLLEYEQTCALSSELRASLESYLGAHVPETIDEAIKDLIDRHGTGRVMFRNTRSAIHGFPKRHLHPYPLTTDEEGNDPHIDWLAKTLIGLRPQKVLVICAQAKTAVALELHLKLKIGIRSAVFHEGLSIIERDRAAAYFAEQENGAQVLICSEIGSEGRNFQFAHHLILYDLPLNPDLLEQRIGRLDRIGQQHTIDIHVPYLIGSAEETLFRWYHEGINLFQKSCSIGCTIYDAFADKLIPLLQQPNEEELNKLIINTQDYTQRINQILHEGRDRLLELSSCNNQIAEDLIALIEREENNIDLQCYMAKVFQEFGVDHEDHSEHCEILRPSDHMKTSHFPGLKEDGVSITYSRRKALIREDMEFLSFEHPMVTESIEMILDSEIGNATLATISVKSIEPGTVFLETFFTINCMAPTYLQLNRFVPISPIRILMDVSLKNLSKILDYNQLNTMCQPLKAHVANAIMKQIREPVESILKQSTQIAESNMQEILQQAKVDMQASLGKELSRLQALQKLNPAIREDEIDFLKQQIADSEYYINHAALKLQALRVIINK